MVNGERIKQAREIRSKTQSEFAKDIGVSQPSIALFESNYKTPSETIMQRISEKTGFPTSFFEQCSSIDFPLGSLLFRAKKSLTLRERNKALQTTKMFYEVYEQLESKFEEIPLRLPRPNDSLLNITEQVRSSLGLSPDTPISDNLTNLIENNGVAVLAIPIAQPKHKHDAFSVWVGNDKKRPVISLLYFDSGDRLRFSIAHELGHLVLHQAIKGEISEIDKEANLFASEFLMPRKAMIKEIIHPVTLLSLSVLKLRWKVSIQALIMRAHDLKIITLRQYTYLMQQVSKRGWRKREPKELDIPVEKPRALRQMVEILYGSPIDFGKLAYEMNLPMEDVIDTFNAHAFKRNSNDKEYNVSEGSKIIDFHKI